MTIKTKIILWILILFAALGVVGVILFVKSQIGGQEVAYLPVQQLVLSLLLKRFD